jgi:hypothetical protein
MVDCRPPVLLLPLLTGPLSSPSALGVLADEECAERLASSDSRMLPGRGETEAMRFWVDWTGVEKRERQSEQGSCARG